MLIECDMTRDENTTRSGIVATRAVVIIRGSKINAWKRTRVEFVFGGGGDVWET